jgi:GNAT superfamily N-acetyltransferase
MEPTLRALTVHDLPGALALSTEASWNQVEDDWRLLLEIAPHGCFGIEVEGELVSTATLVCYGSDLAWVGMVLTKSSHRGQSFATRLLTELLSIADDRGIKSVKLDATEQGKPLYERLGFRTEQPVERWEAENPIVRGPRPPDTSFTTTSLEPNRQAFGADRRLLLERLSRRSSVFAKGCSFAMARPGRVRQYLGPCVAEKIGAARSLISAALNSASPGWYWDLLPANADAVTLAREFGFTPARHLLRMVRGEAGRQDDRHNYALAGFELG